MVATETTITASRDASDNKFLELAADGGADFLITGDKDLLDLARRPDPAWGFSIVTPGAFLKATARG